MSGFSPAPSPIVLGQSAVAVPLTGGTGETTLATITVPAGALGANGRVVIEVDFTHTNSANAKTLRVKWGSSTSYSPAPTTTAGTSAQIIIANRNVTNSQRVLTKQLNSANSTAYGSGTPTQDTTASVDITITGQLALGTETITLESYQVLLYPKG